MDAERRRWLETLAAACERALATAPEDRSDPSRVALREGLAEVLARIRADLAAAEG